MISVNKRMKNLTESEKDLMEIFWAQEEPLTSVEILKIAENSSWNGNYIHVMLRSLQKMGMVRVCGTVQYGTQYARQFTTVFNKEEYAARVAMSFGFEKKSVAKIAMALAQEIGENGEEALIGQLEDIIDGLKGEEAKEVHS